MEWIGRPEIKCCIYNQFIVDKDANTTQYGNIKFSTSGAGTTIEWSNTNKVLTPTAFIKVNSKWDKKIWQTVELLEKNIGIHLCDLQSGNVF